jgi:PAS domain S-box-containing protein
VAALTGAFLLHRISRFDPSLSRLRDALALIVFGALGSALVSASVGVSVLYATHVQAYSGLGSAWLIYWLGDSTGVLLVTPLVLTFPRLLKSRPWADIAEFSALLLILTAISFIVFAKPSPIEVELHVFAFVVLPFIMWAAIRFGAGGAALATFLVATIATLETELGSGPFARNSPFVNAVLLDVFFAVLSVSGMTLATVIAEREQAKLERERLVREQATLETRLQLSAIVQTSDERFRLAAEAGRMYAYEWDAATDIVTRSGECLNVLGLSGPETQLTRAQLSARIHPDDRALFMGVVGQVTPENPASRIIYRTLRSDGSVIWLEKNARAFFDEHGRLQRMVGMVADITHRKLAEEALRTSEERMRLAQQAARIGTFERDVRTGRVTWAAGLESLYGVPPGSLEGKTTAFFSDLLHPADRERVAHLIQEGLKTGRPTEGEWRVIWPDGSVHWIAGRWQVVMDESGEPLRVFGVNMDVTKQKQAEQALHAREELLQIFVKHVPAAVAMLDRDMRYLQVSDRWCTDYLRGRTQILGRSHYEVFPDMSERWKEVHRRGLQGETLRADEDRWDGQDGPHWARWEVRPWHTPEGIVGGILIFAEDITRRKQMEEALLEIPRGLIEAQEQERTRIGRELHDDVTQRLAMLALELDQIHDTPSDVKPLLREVQKRMTEISSDVQAMSHDLHSSKLEYLGVAAGIKSWCKEFGERHRMQIDFVSNVSSVLPLGVGVPLFRVLQEALHNVIKHGGVTQAKVQLREDSGEIHLIVSDSGKGFDVEAALAGKGLGLTSMRERVRLVNGTIVIESKPVGGTTVHVHVPFGLEHRSQAAG